MDKEREQSQTGLVDDQLTVDGRLYDGFIGDPDKSAMRAIRAADPDKINTFSDELHDVRLKNLLPLYKARNYPDALSEEERADWDKFCYNKLLAGGDDSRFAGYFKQIDELSKTDLNREKRYLLEELKLYGESIIPEDAIG